MRSKQLDIESIDPYHLSKENQILCKEKPELRNLEHLFKCEFHNEPFEFHEYLCYLPTMAMEQDTYAMISRHNVGAFKTKFNKLFSQS